MNIVSYNLTMFQLNNKLKDKKYANMLGFDVKTLKKMKKESYVFSCEEIERIAFITGIEKLQTEIHEKINLQEKKIYGANFLNVRYEVLSYQSHNIGLISCIFDILFLVILALLAIFKQFDLTIDTESLNVLRIIVIIELCVFPFMYIVLPLLKIYYNRTYVVKLESKLNENDIDEACGIVYGCLRRSINKSLVPHLFTIFSEGVIAIYAFCCINYTKNIWGYIVMIVLFIISLVNSIYTFTYFFGNKQHKILRS